MRPDIHQSLIAILPDSALAAGIERLYSTR